MEVGVGDVPAQELRLRFCNHRLLHFVDEEACLAEFARDFFGGLGVLRLDVKHFIL